MKKFELDENKLYDLSDFFKLFGDSTRLKILLSFNDDELTVGELTEKLNMNFSAISHQLKILRTSKLIKNRRQGKNIYYSLADDHVKTIISMAIEHLEE